ncbi:SDR family NAD(P)-dependent oxidoreductase [Paraburkholderia fungorum]|uniref:SDR family NAD(P)-dependent oxidoreductase n=1 Tax=Paraburkholderia fungorum TaxID=134537 RepID=UPI00402B7B7A
MKSAVIIGVGAENGLGGALCKRAAAEGYHVFIVGRTEQRLETISQAIQSAGGHAKAIVADVTEEKDVVSLFDQVMASGDLTDAPDLVVYNVGNNKRIDFRDVSLVDFESFMRTGPIGAFLVGREVARRLVPLGRGTLIFTGASASLRGRPGFGHFAASKAAVRMISQCMAREYGPQGLHVAHVLVDGGIDGERLRTMYPDAASERGEDGLLAPEAIADGYWHLHTQQRSAWTQELDLRPFKEQF